MTMPELAVDNLSKSFGETSVLQEVSFTVAEGEFCVLLGPSGCGKTTLLRIIAGLEEADEGDIAVDGESLTGLSPGRRDVAMVFQTYALYPHMSVFDNMAFPLKARKLPADEIRRRVERAARLLGIHEKLDSKPRELSGGQRQRVAIGRAIVRSPRLFLFDEPLSNLDASLRTEMRVEVARLHRELEATMIYVTHDQVEAMTLADKVVLLHAGRIQQIGAPSALYDRPANRFVARFIGSPTMNLIDGVLEAGDGGPVFHADDVDLRLGELDVDVGGAREVTLGVRPEALVPRRLAGDGAPTGGETGRPATDDDVPAGPGTRATVELVENIGAESIVHLRRGGTSLVARAASQWDAAPGDEVELTWNAERLYLFDGDSGETIHPRG
jgi:ABC-type sugar transport system ATPase subunit